MTFFARAQHIAGGSRQRSRGHMISIMLGCAVTASAIALVAYLLWPTSGSDASSSPARFPGSIGATVFNLPTMAIPLEMHRRCALHARRRATRDVPERAPHRRRRSDLSLSAELARAMARRGPCHGPLDGAIARAEGLIVNPV